MEQEIRLVIKNALENVTKTNSPEIYKRIQTKAGYLQIENLILERMIGNVQTAEAIIPQIENEFSE